jgi:NAD(P)-dependent dehydrogenase (short-subunit alcohol dehydrogenase family)
LASAAASYGVRVNCLVPGPVDTPRFRAMNGGDAGVEQVRKRIPLGAIARPADCANAAIFLLSDAAAQITGQALHVNGGLLMP